MGALDPSAAGRRRVAPQLSGKELRDLGRLPYPMVRRTGRAGLPRGSAGTRRSTSSPTGSGPTEPDRFGLYLTARGLTNETYYVAQKLVRFLGSNNIDNAARVCHAPSTIVLKQTIGVGATTVSYTDVIGTDLVVLVRQQRRQRAAGVHEVPVPGPASAGRRSRSSTRCASRASSATGCRATSRARCSARRWPTSSSACTRAATSRSSTAC